MHVPFIHVYWTKLLILLLGSMAFCPNCGKDVSPEAFSCPESKWLTTVQKVSKVEAKIE